MLHKACYSEFRKGIDGMQKGRHGSVEIWNPLN